MMKIHCELAVREASDAKDSGIGLGLELMQQLADFVPTRASYLPD